ncbi:MAG: 1-aminocyclopropane-carboxylate deaminase [Solirubrobacterales bacterium]|nr:1-aminocyclopropane-carboxylate deaminase [Solirubrobacterales bacterium]
MTAAERVAVALGRVPRMRLATLPTPLERGADLPGGGRLVVKRDDLSGLGLGGNKARKLEFLCGAAVAAGADTLVTVGAAQSNHARVTAAAGAVLGVETHLVLGGVAEEPPAGNQLLARMFGAHLHPAGTDDWGELSGALAALVDELRAAGRRPFAIPMGGSDAVGAVGFLAAWAELAEQCTAEELRPTAVVHASSTAGTHGGLLAGRAVWAAAGEAAPDIIAVDVAKDSDDLAGDAARLAGDVLASVGLGDVAVDPALVELDERWVGPAYAVPTAAGDAAVTWAARHGAWVLDRTYTGKAFAGLLSLAEQGRFAPDSTVVFWHTGGFPAVFAPGGAVVPDATPAVPTPQIQEIT